MGMKKDKLLSTYFVYVSMCVRVERADGQTSRMHPLVSSTMAGWKIPELNGGFNRNITYKWSIFQPAMFDYQRVLYICTGHLQ